jgi:hypothetical protein
MKLSKKIRFAGFLVILSNVIGVSAVAGLPDLKHSGIAMDEAFKVASQLKRNGDSRVNYEINTDHSKNITSTNASFEGVFPGTKNSCVIRLSNSNDKESQTFLLEMSVFDSNPQTLRHGCDAGNTSVEVVEECMKNLKSQLLSTSAGYQDDLITNSIDLTKIRESYTVPYYLSYRNEAELSVSSSKITLIAKFVESPAKQNSNKSRDLNWNLLRSSDSMTCEFTVK